MMPTFQIPLPGMMPFQQIQQVQVRQGQFPPPDEIERYVAVQPDAFDRILKMAERQQEAAITAGAQAMTYQADDIRRGHWLGAATTMLAIAAAGTVSALGGPVAVSIALVGVPVMTVAKALIDSVTANRQAKTQQIAVANAAEQSAEE